jgi:hypothetical protein
MVTLYWTFDRFSNRLLKGNADDDDDVCVYAASSETYNSNNIEYLQTVFTYRTNSHEYYPWRG